MSKDKTEWEMVTLYIGMQETLKCIFTLKFIHQYRFLNLRHFYFYPPAPKVTGNSKSNYRGLTNKSESWLMK